ncbi:conserved hypothetical protein [Vibrio phage 501E54-1]|nr:conserved hypothetical protein [Vibrio phage 501E54-1]
MEYFQNLKLIKEDTPKGVVYKIVFKVSEAKEEAFIVKPEAIEHLINQYRSAKI